MHSEKIIGVVIILFMLVTSCRKDKTVPPQEGVVQKYLHLSHTRTESNMGIANSLDEKNFDQYDILMLGGDLNWLTSEDDATMNYIDGIFDLGNEHTLWTLGNHDYTDTVLVTSYTDRPTYYAYYKDGITFLVLDTQADECNISGEQLAMIQNVADTIQESSHLILLHHKLIWMPDNDVLEPQISSVSNGSQGTLAHQLQYNNFYDDVYPELQQVNDQGISVFCIGGDIGLITNQFSYVDPNGINFLASGVNYQTTDNYALVFTHDVTFDLLSWDFISVNDL